MKNNKSLKRFLVFLVCMAMFFAYMPSAVYAGDGDNGEATPVVSEEPASAPETKAAPAAAQADEEKKEEVKDPEPASNTGEVTEPTDPNGGSGNDGEGGTTDPAGGTTDPAGGTTDPAGGTTDPAGGITDPAGDVTEPADPASGAVDQADDVADQKDSAGDVKDPDDPAADPEGEEEDTEEIEEEAPLVKGPIVLRDGSVILEYHESYTLPERSGSVNRYEVRSTQGGFNLSGHTVTNQNEGSGDRTAVIRHTWGHYVLIFFVEDGHEDITITLKPDKVTVTFMLQDVGSEEFTKYDEQTLYKGENVTKPEMEDPKEGCDFHGWYTDEGLSDLAVDADFQSITETKVFYGKYSSQATLTYKKNSGSDAATIPDNVTAGIGTKVKIGTASRSGYSLVEWNTAADGSGTSYSPGDSVKMPAEGLTLYAQWSDTKISINYWKNYGDESSGPWYSDPEAEIESRATITEDVPPARPRTGIYYYMFRGWATGRNADNPQYNPGDTINTGSSDINLYAVWGRISLNDLDDLSIENVEYTYDGEEHSITPSDIQGGQGKVTQHGHTYIKVGDTAIIGNEMYAMVDNITVTGVDAGHYSTPLTAPLYYRGLITGEMLRVDYAPYIEITGGKLTIKPAKILISTKSDEKAYDGEPLTADGKATIKNDDDEVVVEGSFSYGGTAVSLFKDDTLNIRSTGEQTDVGESDNDYEVDWGKPDDWKNDLSASTAKKYNYEVATDELGTLTVYKEFEVTFVDEDGTVLKEAAKYKEGTAAADIETPADPTKPDDDEYSYTFDGWSPELADVTEDVTYTATYKATKLYGEITYDLNGGTYNGSTDDIVEKHKIGETISIHEAPTREGYVFDYWQGSEYQPGDEYTVEEDHTFTAIWVAEETPEEETDEPDEPEKTKKSSKSKGVDTGDENNMMELLGLMSMSALGLAALCRRRREQE